MLKKLSTLYYKSSWLKSCTAVVVEHTFSFTFTCMSLHHCVTLWKCKKIKYHLDIVIFLHPHRMWVFFKYPKISKNGNLLFFPVDLSIFCMIIFRFVGWHHLPGESQDFLRGLTSLRFLKGTKITVYEFLTKRRFRKTRNATVTVFLRWQVTLFLQLELQLSPQCPLHEHPLLLFALPAERALTTTSLWSYLTIRDRFGKF